MTDTEKLIKLARECGADIYDIGNSGIIGIDFSQFELLDFYEAAKAEGAREEREKCKHTPCPSGYLDWHQWAEKKAKTHTQHKCPNCGLWAIWQPKESQT